MIVTFQLGIFFLDLAHLHRFLRKSMLNVRLWDHREIERNSNEGELHKRLVNFSKVSLALS